MHWLSLQSDDIERTRMDCLPEVLPINLYERVPEYARLSSVAFV